MADEFFHAGKENCSEQARRSQVSGPRSQFQRSFIQRVTLSGKLPTRFVLHRERKQKVAAISGVDQEAMKSLPEGDLDHCSSSKVDSRRQQISQTMEEVQKIIHSLTTEISRQDSRFEAVPVSDTHNESIKVLAPSLFHVTVPSKGLAGYKGVQRQRWRYYNVQGAKLTCPSRDPEGSQQWSETEMFMKTSWQWHKADVNIEGDIVPAKVSQVFRTSVENAVRTCHLSGKVTVLEKRTTVWVAMETSTGQVESESAPTVEIPTTWPEKAQWPRCSKRWPSPERVECIKSFGFNLVAQSAYHWQSSFSQAEQVSFEQSDEDGGCRRQCFQVSRQSKEDVWCPGRRPVITTHHSQTVLFWTCEKYPHLKDWQVFHQALSRLVRKSHRCVSQHFSKHYFVPKSNLLQSANPSESDAVAQKVAFFLKNPQVESP